MLKSHLEAMALANGKAVAATALAKHLSDMESERDLILLRIDDYGACGLTGPEFADEDMDSYGTFIKLLRTDLFSDKDAGAGASYGLGKSAYWAYSRIRTTIFSSAPTGWSPGLRRVLGVNQGLSHSLEGTLFDGRGFFGIGADGGMIKSEQTDDASLRDLMLDRDSDETGTSALVIGFHDPQNPEATIDDLADGLRAGIEQNFWPLITRGRVEITVTKIDGDVVTPVSVDPRRTYGDLCRALQLLDGGGENLVLAAPGDVIVRPLTIRVPRRISNPTHPSFEHEAKLVITYSDEVADDLENTISLFRRPEMIVEVLRKQYPGRVYHAFLVAGAAVRPNDLDANDESADDFLRFAEPPSHNHWIPTSNQSSVSRENLRNNYRNPFIRNLEDIKKSIFKELDDIFNAPPPRNPNGPEAITKHLKFLNRGDAPPPAPRKPTVAIASAAIDPASDSWIVRVVVDAPNRAEGWSFDPVLAFVGDDGKQTIVKLLAIEDATGCSIEDGRVVISGPKSRKRLTAQYTMRSDASSHPIPSSESAVAADLAGLGTATSKVTS